MKKLLPIILILITVLVLTGCTHKKDQPANDTAKPTAIPTPTPPETQLPPEERPVVDMRTDQQVRRLFFTIDNLPEDVTKVEYIVTYKTNDLERGGFGIYDNGQKAEEEYLFGSESSGIFKYDENISQILLTIEYRSQGQKILLRYPYQSAE
jgi:hypothetical protein